MLALHADGLTAESIAIVARHWWGEQLTARVVKRRIRETREATGSTA